jgi:hypothetical protein
MLLEDEFATRANRAADVVVGGGVDGWVEGVLTPPQPKRSMGPTTIRIERAIFFTEALLLIENR